MPYNYHGNKIPHLYIYPSLFIKVVFFLQFKITLWVLSSHNVGLRKDDMCGWVLPKKNLFIITVYLFYLFSRTYLTDHVLGMKCSVFQYILNLISFWIQCLILSRPKIYKALSSAKIFFVCYFSCFTLTSCYILSYRNQSRNQEISLQYKYMFFSLSRSSS